MNAKYEVTSHEMSDFWSCISLFELLLFLDWKIIWYLSLESLLYSAYSKNVSFSEFRISFWIHLRDNVVITQDLANYCAESQVMKFSLAIPIPQSSLHLFREVWDHSCVRKWRDSVILRSVCRF